MFRKICVISFFLLMLIYSILSCDLPGRFRCNSNFSGYYICTDGIETLYNCSEGQHCDMIGKNCSSQISSLGPEGYKFRCSSDGLFPDPYDCTKYYKCGPAPGDSLYNPEPLEGLICSDGFAYNPGSTLCDFNLTDDECRIGPVPKCEVEFQTDSLRTNQSIFYICTDLGSGLIPLLFRCKSGYYNSTICKCHNSNASRENYSGYPCSFNDTQTTTYSSDVTDESSDSTTEIPSTMSSSVTEQQTSTDTTITPTSTSISSTDQTAATTDNGMDSTTNEETTTDTTITEASTSTSSTDQTTETTDNGMDSTTNEETTTDTTITEPSTSTTSTDQTTETTDNGMDSTTNKETTTESTIFISSTEPSTEETTSTLFTTTMTSSTTETETTTTVPTESTTHPEFTCTRPGKFPDPYDCHYFYICNIHLDHYRYSCPEGSIFNPQTSECEEGDVCPALPTQTTEIITTTKEVTTHIPFQCEGPGIYPDCYDCHAYYLCTVTGQMFHIYCDSGSHFSAEDQVCINGEDCPSVIC